MLDASAERVYFVDMAELLGMFELVILLAVHGLADEAYGRSILRDVQTGLDRDSVAAGAVYATLDRLETKGLLSSRVAEGTPARGGRAKRYYKLTSQGAAALTETRSTLEKMWTGKRWPTEVVV